MEYSKESIDRQKKIKILKEAWIICYANNFRWKQDISFIKKQAEKEFNDIDNLIKTPSLKYKSAWRIISSRFMWKLIFMKLRDHSWDIQICFMKDKLVLNTGKVINSKDNLWDSVEEIVESLYIWEESKTAFKILEKFCQVWDYIWVKWDIFFTKHSELSIFVSEFQILSKSLRPLPEKFHWLNDKETIYRQRYLDLIINEDSYQRFIFRSKFIKVLRDFYDLHSFIEIETPVLWNSASWAAAAPFITHHNDFDEDYFLRISPETALKKTTVGRFERVVEFARDFRNEWSDPSHLQEFSMIEHYAAWWNFEDNMSFTKQMFDYIFEKMNISKQVSVKNKDWLERIVDFSKDFEMLDYIAWVKEKSWIDISLYNSDDEEKLREDIKKAWYSWPWIDIQSTSTMIDYLYKKVLRPSILWPTFVYNYPKTIQPLARESDQNPNIVEQFQLVINGIELVKAYSELVDPKLQKQKFEEQALAIKKWDIEATSWDDDFILAMEYWMPCQSGWGMWIDRIVSILTWQDNLRDVVLFPIMKTIKE